MNNITKPTIAEVLEKLEQRLPISAVELDVLHEYAHDQYYHDGCGCGCGG